jgi:hypothetical protein
MTILVMLTTDTVSILHIGPAEGDQYSTWLLGAMAGFVLAVVVARLVRPVE